MSKNEIVEEYLRIWENAYVVIKIGRKMPTKWYVLNFDTHSST